MQPGIHLVHKPVGPSSFAVLRSVVPQNLRSCHGGTLDPFARGLLLVLIEPATQLFDMLHDVPKVYEATIRWGVETDNGDPTGSIISRGGAAHLTASLLNDASCHSLVGTSRCRRPRARNGSAVNVRTFGHRGENVTLPPAKVYLHSAEWMHHDLPEGKSLADHRSRRILCSIACPRSGPAARVRCACERVAPHDDRAMARSAAGQD